MSAVWPIAVYGTLRPDCGNDRLWRGRASCSDPAVVRGMRLLTSGAFPYAVDSDPDDAIIVQLLTPHPGCADDLLAVLDRLEGYPSHYDRRRVTAWLGGRPVEATIYVPADMAWTVARTHLYEVPQGDWVAGWDDPAEGWADDGWAV